jgi:anti-sigma factor RsiW
VVNKDWLDIDVLEDYLDGKLDAKTMNRVEREALEDPFVAEALAGLSASPKRALASISLLQRQLAERIDQQKTIKKQSVITWQRLSVGSAAAVLFITVGIVYWMKQANYDRALNSSKKVEVVIAPKKEQDSIVSKAVIPDALLLSKGEAIAQNTKTKRAAGVEVVAEDKIANPEKFVAQDKVAGQDKAIAQDKVVSQDKVAVSASPTNLQLSRRSASTLSATAMALPNSYDSNFVKGNVAAGIKSKEATDVPVGNVEQLLQGKVARLSIQNKTGAAGAIGSNRLLTTATVQSHPVNGWDHYFMYITDNSKFKGQPRLGKSVQVTFTVDTNGLAQNIKVIKGISSTYDKEAIRLIKEGPGWLQPEPINSLVSFKIDF